MLGYNPSQTKDRKMKYVIEKLENGTREWWTGEDWSDVETDAEWFEEREHAETKAAEWGGTVTGFEVE